jgi:hypothetical protein
MAETMTKSRFEVIFDAEGVNDARLKNGDRWVDA